MNICLKRVSHKGTISALRKRYQPKIHFWGKREKNDIYAHLAKIYIKTWYFGGNRIKSQILKKIRRYTSVSLICKWRNNPLPSIFLQKFCQNHTTLMAIFAEKSIKCWA